MLTYVATKNAGKLDELRAIFAGSPLQLQTYPAYADVAEDADDYAGNARLKARGLRAQLLAAGLPGAVLADDSGLEVTALGGRPGIFSARYAGADAGWDVRREKLLHEVAAARTSDRSAVFVCALVLLADGSEIAARGEVRGAIVERLRGQSGFGYDPLFVADGDDRTFAQLSEVEKNARSHRARAAHALLIAMASAHV